MVRTRFSARDGSSDLACDTPTRTEQCHKDMCDINNVIRRCAAGILPQVKPMNFLDCTSFGDFQTMQNKVLAVNNYFNSLPASIREQFGNNVLNFADFATDPANAKTLHEMGLLELPEIATLPEAGQTPPASSGENNQPSNETASTL